jgi:hypothetical protein
MDAAAGRWRAGEQLLFMRTFEGYEQKGTYVEIFQKLLHVFALHFLEERNVYCRLDERGDLEDVIAVSKFDDPRGGYSGGTVVTIKRGVIDEYMAVTNTTIVRMFDLTRFRPKAFRGWSRGGDAGERADGDLYYRFHIEAGHGSYMRGVQIVRSRMSREEAARKVSWGQPKDRKYESFVAVDRKNGGIVCEVSTEPGKTANYFVESRLPWEISPAFFRPDVLLRYKEDTDKYSLRQRSISRRGAWHLQTHDINDAGQVHTYIAYLRDLPYEEQLLASLPLPPHTADRRSELQALYQHFEAHIDRLDERVKHVADERPRATLLLTHPGVGPVTALATDVFVGDPARFPDGKALASYVGMIPREYSSGKRQRLGALSKQGNPFLRFLWCEAAAHAVRRDPDLQRFYRRKVVQKGFAKARVAAARKLGIRLWIMLRDQIDYAEFCRRGLARQS